MTQLVVGLGNPGSDYATSRHNVGFWIVEALAEQLRMPWRRERLCRIARAEWAGILLILAKPTTYMNRSGSAVATLLQKFGLDLSGLILVHDDIDLPVGKVRVRHRGGHGGHHGVQSVIETLGSGAFRRVKVGIGRPETKDAVVDYVLTPLGDQERLALAGAVAEAREAVLNLVREGSRE